MRMRLLMSGVTALLGVTLVACGSSSPTTPSAPAATVPSTSASTNAQPTPSCTIPQNNGGDHDADNNGGPSDGDGCDT